MSQSCRFPLAPDDAESPDGFHRTYVGSVERGERDISLDAVYALADALGVPAHALLTPP